MKNGPRIVGTHEAFSILNYWHINVTNCRKLRIVNQTVMIIRSVCLERLSDAWNITFGYPSDNDGDAEDKHVSERMKRRNSKVWSMMNTLEL